MPRPQKQPAKQPPPAANGARSIRDLAAAVRKSHTAVAKWVRDDRWTFGPGPWDAAAVVRIRAWAAQTLAGNPAAAADGPADLSIERKAKLALTGQRIEALQIANQAKRGDLHSVTECTRQRLRQIHEVKTAFLNMADGLPLDPDSKVIVKGRVLEILRSFSGAAAAPHAPGQPDPAAAVV